MRNRHWILFILAGTYAAFWVWHTPLRGAIEPYEWRAMVAAQGGDATEIPAHFAAFLDADDGRPFHMINILDNADTANYPDGELSNITTAQGAARAYAVRVIPQLLLRGSYPMFTAARHTTFLDTIPAEHARFESFAIVRYRSRRDLLDLMISPAFQASTVHKWASLNGTIVIPARRGAFADLSLLVPLSLLVLAGLSVLRRRRNGA